MREFTIIEFILCGLWGIQLLSKSQITRGGATHTIHTKNIFLKTKLYFWSRAGSCYPSSLSNYMLGQTKMVWRAATVCQHTKEFSRRRKRPRTTVLEYGAKIMVEIKGLLYRNMLYNKRNFYQNIPFYSPSIIKLIKQSTDS